MFERKSFGRFHRWKSFRDSSFPSGQRSPYKCSRYDYLRRWRKLSRRELFITAMIKSDNWKWRKHSGHRGLRKSGHRASRSKHLTGFQYGPLYKLLNGFVENRNQKRLCSANFLDLPRVQFWSRQCGGGERRWEKR